MLKNYCVSGTLLKYFTCIISLNLPQQPFAVILLALVLLFLDEKKI